MTALWVIAGVSVAVMAASVVALVRAAAAARRRTDAFFADWEASNREVYAMLDEADARSRRRMDEGRERFEAMLAAIEAEAAADREGVDPNLYLPDDLLDLGTRLAALDPAARDRLRAELRARPAPEVRDAVASIRDTLSGV